MSETSAVAAFDARVDKRVAVRMGLVGIVIAATAVAGLLLVFLWTSSERERDLRVWQDRMGIVAESRVQAVSRWVSEQRLAVTALAGNDAVRLYTDELIDPAYASQGRPIEAQYLENLLVVSAERAGFTAPPQATAVGANVARAPVAGLGIVAADGRLLVSTPGMPGLPADVQAAMEISLATGKPYVSRLYAGAGGPTIAVAAPMLAVQDDKRIAAVIGIKPVAGELYPLLAQPGATERTAEALLVVRKGATIEYASPLADGTAPLTRTMAADTPQLAAAFALAEPGGFGRLRDYRNVEVLATSRLVGGTDWALLYKIDRDEALADSDARLEVTLGVLSLIVVLVTVGALLVWRHGTSQRAARAAQLFRDLAERFEHQAGFIRRLTDSQPNGIFIATPDGRLTFANAALAATLDAGDADALVGKPLAAVFGPHEARRHQRVVEDVLEAGKPERRIDRVEGLRGERVLQRQYIPLEASRHTERGVLVIEEDLSDAIRARERAERVLQQLVATLLSVVDRRDPYAADQSARVAEVARLTAEEMTLEAVLVDAVDKAARLMNLGKVFVPVEILTKEGRLTDEEFSIVRRSIDEGVELLAGIEFEGPVADTLRQARAKWDGSGEPAGLAGDAILVTARIVAVANAFVAMTSARAHRAGMPVDSALTELMQSAGKAFDRRVVAALANLVENRGLRARIEGSGDA